VNNGTCETTPIHIWMHEVLSAAKASHEESKPHRARLQLWYRSGEPVWMAADGLRQLVSGAQSAKREVGGVDELRAVIRRSA
jgi:hypothetical protein